MHFQYKDVLRVKRQHEHQAEEERRAHRQVVDTGLHFNMVSTVAIACALLREHRGSRGTAEKVLMEQENPLEEMMPKR